MAVADSRIRQLLQPVVEALGCELWGVDLQTGDLRLSYCEFISIRITI